ncbi:hypothetical protein BDY21DRAFT_354375 [Lineolata rhizophorae]|uniref:Uncharacterized protein n=1 Tax=Lineolata rhizophorae TaxID=578093 RepID=A0A6A6NQ96_9PEZI|nr:hypothetical protein BDY21DRAFT_354375 [Lineolata rhizophorae]
MQKVYRKVVGIVSVIRHVPSHMHYLFDGRSKGQASPAPESHDSWQRTINSPGPQREAKPSSPPTYIPHQRVLCIRPPRKPLLITTVSTVGTPQPALRPARPQQPHPTRPRGPPHHPRRPDRQPGAKAGSRQRR